LISKILMESGFMVFKGFFYKESESRTETLISKICESIEFSEISVLVKSLAKLSLILHHKILWLA